MKLSKTLIVAFVLATASVSWADSYSVGTNYLAQTNISQALNALTNAASPANPNAEAFLALTRLLALPNDPATSGFLNDLGISQAGRKVFDWQAKPEKNANGHTVVPPAFSTAEIGHELTADVVPTLAAAKANLAAITAPTFSLLLPATVTHFGGDVTMDYGDAQMLKAMLDAQTVFDYEFSTWNLNGNYGAESNAVLKNKSIESLLTSYPTLLTVTNPANLPLARQAFTNAVNEYFAASQLIRSRPPGERRLFNLDASDLTAEENFRTSLSNLENSLNGPVALNSKATTKVNLGAFFNFNAKTNLRTLLPQQTSQGATFIWDSFPDTTLGGVVTGLTQTNLGKVFIKMFHEQAQLVVPGTTMAVVTSASGLDGSLNGVVLGKDGNLYGTSQYGGSMGAGTFYEAGINGTFKIRYSFETVQNDSFSSADGGGPSGLVLGNDGNFYGTTQYGGANGKGTIFKMTPAGSLATLYNFGNQADIGASGGNPLIQGTDGNFYGTTQGEGTGGEGIIFQFSLAGNHFKVLGSFPIAFSVNPNGGGAMAGALIQGQDGKFYGVTEYGGDQGAGSLFQFTPGTDPNSGTFHTLHSFPGTYDVFGNFNSVGINTPVQAANGLFYGTTQASGNNYGQATGPEGDGMIYSVDTSGKFTVLYSFDENHFDGFGPIGPLAQGANGTFYGLTSSGGANGSGTIFQFTPGQAPNFLVWFNDGLGKQQGDENGYFYYNASQPYAGLVQSAGHFYGTAPNGNNGGTVYNLTPSASSGKPPAPPTIASQPITPVNVAQAQLLSLTVGAGGTGPFSYQWRHNAVNLTDNERISGSGASTLTIYPASTDDSGNYDVIVSNGGGSAKSKASVVTVGTAPYVAGPASQTSLVGSSATLSVDASGTAPLHFQWRKNGTAAANNVAGATSSTLTLANLTLASAGNYVVIVTNNFGSVTSAPAVLTVVQGPIVTSPPVPPKGLLAGQPLSLKVTATGSGLSYFWLLNSAYLTDGGIVSGSSSSTLLINPADATIAGTYSVIVSNSIGAVAKSIVVTVGEDKIAPLVTILSPATGARSNSPIMFRGTASDNAQVTIVNYWITNLNGSLPMQGQASLAAGTSTASNWTITLSPPAGSNIFTVQSQDFSGNNSKLVSVKFFAKSPSPLIVSITGSGSGTTKGVSPLAGDAAPTNGALLNVGETYSITAIPGPGSYFASWAGLAGTTTNPTLTFLMQSNTLLTASFVTNIFIGMAGTYNGLFSSADLGPTAETAGLISGLTLNSNGGYSGTLKLAGASPSLSGVFTHDGYATNTVLAGADGKVTVQLYVNADSVPRTITGFVIGTNAILSNGANAKGWISSVSLIASANNPGIDAGAYTLLIPPTGAGVSLEDASLPASVSPSGFGFAVLTNLPTKGKVPAAVTLSGALADGAVLLQTVPIGEDNGIPIYEAPYNNNTSGLLFGRVSLADNTPSGSLTWIRKASPSGIFRAGFTNVSSVNGAPWSTTTPIAAVIQNNSQLFLSGADLGIAIATLSLNKTNLVRGNGSPVFVSGSVNTNTGQFTIMLNDNGVHVTGHGALLEPSGTGYGYFILGPAAEPDQFRFHIATAAAEFLRRGKSGADITLNSLEMIQAEPFMVPGNGLFGNTPSITTARKCSLARKQPRAILPDIHGYPRQLHRRRLFGFAGAYRDLALGQASTLEKVKISLRSGP